MSKIKDDGLLPERDPQGGVDNLLAGLNTITPQDAEAMRQQLHPESSTERAEDVEKRSPHTAQYMKIIRALYGNSTISSLFDDTGKSTSREQYYAIYDEMDDTTAYVTSALDILSDDATQPDDDGNLIYIESDSEKVKTVISNLFESLDIESRLSKWARAIAKYGDLFVQVYGSTEKDHRGISSIDDTVYPARVSRRDFRGKLVAFVENDTGMVSEDTYLPPWEFVHFRHKGELSPVHSTELGRDTAELVSSYGQSVLKAAVKVYTQLRFVENMILLARLTNSVRRNIFSINVGEVDPSSAFETIKTYADTIKKDINLNIEDQLYNSAKHTAKYDEDIFIPVSDPKNDIAITTIGGDANIAEQYDLEYLLNKLFAALKIPKAYLNYEQDLNARSTLIQLDIRYARSVAQLQKTLVTGLTRLANIHLAYCGIDPEVVSFKISLTSVSAIDQEARLEQTSAKISAASDFWNVVEQVNSTLKDAKDSQQDSLDSMDTEPSSFGGGSSSGFDFSGSEDTGSPEEVGEETTEEEPTEESPETTTSSPSGSIDTVKDTLRAKAGAESKRYKGKRLTESMSDREPSKESLENKYDSPINLTYLARRLFKDYLDFSDDEVEIIMGGNKDTKSTLESLSKSKKRRSSIHSISDDSSISYPTEEGRRFYESTLKDLISSYHTDDSEESDDNIGE